MYRSTNPFKVQLRNAVTRGTVLAALSLLCAAPPAFPKAVQDQPMPEEIADYEAALEEAESLQPDSSRFEYVGSIAVRPPWIAALARPDEPVKVHAASQEASAATKRIDVDRVADLMDIATLDGRMFRQRPGTNQVRQSTRTLQEGDEFTRALALVGIDGIRSAEQSSAPTGEDTEPSTGSGGSKRTGGGDRTTSTSRQGVMVKLAKSSRSKYVACSASMISPRIFLTSAHCITDGNGNWDYDGKVEYAIPSARGASYSGSNNTLDSNDRPWGSRKIIAWIKPSGWNGSSNNARYDYALLVIKDYPPDNSGKVEWKPSPVFVRQELCVNIDYSHINLRGYPGYSRSCSDASSEDAPKCGGYAYAHYADTDECVTNFFVHNASTLPGESGSPAYHYISGKRYVVGIYKGEYGSRKWAHKIRSGSMSLICDILEDPDYQSSYFPDFHCD